MKILLPESIKDITLGQFQTYDKLTNKLENKEIEPLEFLKRKVSLFSGIPYSKIDDVLQTDLEDVITQIDIALNEDSVFENRFTLDGIEFGFIENLDTITSGEYFDLSNYGTDVDKLHKLMAVLFRPIKKEDKFGNYKIKKYNGSAKYSELMKKTPLNIVNGSLVFFCNLSSELEIHIQKSTETRLKRGKKQTHTLNNGVGTVPSMN